MNLARRLCVVSLVLPAFASTTLIQAQEAFVGTWVLDPSGYKGIPQLMPSARNS